MKTLNVTNLSFGNYRINLNMENIPLEYTFLGWCIAENEINQAGCNINFCSTYGILQMLISAQKIIFYHVNILLLTQKNFLMVIFMLLHYICKPMFSMLILCAIWEATYQNNYLSTHSNINIRRISQCINSIYSNNI